MTRTLLAALAFACAGPAAADDPLDRWVAETAALKGPDQATAVQTKLRELNPEFRAGEVQPRVVDGVLRGLTVPGTYVRDIRPLRAAKDLETLSIRGENNRPSKIDDLAPLLGLKLKELRIEYSAVASLAPLKGMPLTVLTFHGTLVRDIRLLKDMPLVAVELSQVDPKSLGVFADKELVHFVSADIGLTTETFKTAFGKSKFRHFSTNSNSGLSTLDGLRGHPLHHLNVGWNVNLARLDGLKGCDTLRVLRVNHTAVADLTPLKGLQLQELGAYNCPNLRDLTPLKGMTSLQQLSVGNSGVTDLAVVSSLTDLEHLGVENLRLRSLKPLAGLTKVKSLYLTGAVIADRDYAPLAKLPLEAVRVDVHPKTGKPDPALARVLKTVKTLKTINHDTAEEVLK